MWVLIIFVFSYLGGGSMAATSVKFNTKDSCNQALEIIKNNTKQNIYNVVGFCQEDN